MVHVTYNTCIYLHTHMKGCTSLFAKAGLHAALMLPVLITRLLVSNLKAVYKALKLAHKTCNQSHCSASAPGVRIVTQFSCGRSKNQTGA